MPLETFPYDSAEYLDTAETIAWYIIDTVASGDPREMARSLDVVERARQMHQIKGRDGTSFGKTQAVRQGEELPALLAILDKLGFQLSMQPVEAEQPAEAA